MNRTFTYSMAVLIAAAIAVTASRSASSAGQGTALVRLQSATPGTPQTGNANLTGTLIAGQHQGGGAGLTGLNATNISSGTVADARLSSNVALLGTTQTFSALKIFGGSFQIPGGGGAGKFLMSDGAGVASWSFLPAPTGTAGGDLSGTYPNPLVDGLQGRAVASTAPTTGQVLGWTGSTWSPTTMPPPSGAAGGDLSGTYPNPTLAILAGSLTKVSGGALSTNGTLTNVNGSLNIASASDALGNLRFTAANPYIVASSYAIIPGGAYFTSAPVYFNGSAEFRAGVHNDSNTYLTISGGTAGVSHFPGSVGVGKTNPATPLDVNGTISTNGAVSITSASDGQGNLRFTAANPYIKAASYLVIPGGAFFNSGSVYIEPEVEIRGGIRNDTGSYLSIKGGTSGATHFAGSVGIGTTSPSELLEIRGGAGPTSITFQPGKWYGVDTANNATIDIPGTGDVLFWDNVHVNNTFTAGSKLFEIDHPLDPLNKFLRHACIESNELKNLYDDVVTTDAKGYATITVPDWFTALNEKFRYQVTVLEEDDSDDFVMVKVARKLKDGAFVIRTNKPGVEVSWQITGVRKDAFAKANPLIVEDEKPKAMRGKYLHPDAFKGARP